jgi:hypothetical protein
MNGDLLMNSPLFLMSAGLIVLCIFMILNVWVRWCYLCMPATLLFDSNLLLARLFIYTFSSMLRESSRPKNILSVLDPIIPATEKLPALSCPGSGVSCHD